MKPPLWHVSLLLDFCTFRPAYMFSGINYVQKSGTACNMSLSLKLLHINSNFVIYTIYRIQIYACQLCDASSHNFPSLTAQPKHMAVQWAVLLTSNYSITIQENWQLLTDLLIVQYMKTAPASVETGHSDTAASNKHWQ